jgi:hypothetical protein
MIMRYTSAAAFRQALESHILQRSQETGLSIVRLRKGATFNRMLARLLDVAPDRWLLKGALALDFRLGVHARATLDMDLGRDDNAEAATADLLAAQERNLGDYFSFAVERTDRLDALHEGAAIRYHVHAEVAGRTFEHVIVDVGFTDRPTGKLGDHAELITAPDLFGFAGIAPLIVPVIILDHHIAEKVHAYPRASAPRPYCLGSKAATLGDAKRSPIVIMTALV